MPTPIRTAAHRDVEAIVELTWRVAAEGRWLGTEVPFDRQDRADRLTGWIDRAGATVLVADDGGAGSPEVIGYLSMVIAPYGVADVGMLLDPDWRGRGVGGALLDAGLSWATAAGAHKAGLEVWPHNAAGLALYRSRGFTEEGRKIHHYRRANGELWDGVIMGLPLGRTGPRPA